MEELKEPVELTCYCGRHFTVWSKTHIIGLAKGELTYSQAIKRIAEIDHYFETAQGWGSAMIMQANEREHLATRFGLPQRFQARTASGGRTN